MKKIYGLLTGLFFLAINSLQAQINVEITYPAQQTGQYNYYGVKVILDQPLNGSITVNGYVYDDGSPNNNHPFTLTIPGGDISAETEWNFYQTCPACGAAASLSAISSTYAGASITYDMQSNMLVFSSTSDVNAVLDQLEADYETYNTEYESQYPNLTAEQLDAMDVQNNFDQFKPFKDFESLFPGYYSKRSEVENIENSWLNNNFTGSDPDDTDLTFDDALNTIFNTNYSFKLENIIYHLTSTGMYIGGVLNEDIGTIASSFDLNDLNLGDFNSVATYSVKSGPLLNEFSYNLAPGCKTNKKDKIFPTFDNDTKRVKQKVSITSIGIHSSAGSKIVYYKRNSNGNWKHARTDMAVTAGGTIYNRECTQTLQFSLRNPISDFKKRNRIAVRAKSNSNSQPSNVIWKTFTNQVGMTFELQNLATGSLILTF